MESTTPIGDTKADVRSNTRARHGDVDRNGDLVDELAVRLRAAISAASPAEEDAQLRAVVGMIHAARLLEARP